MIIGKKYTLVGYLKPEVHYGRKEMSALHNKGKIGAGN